MATEAEIGRLVVRMHGDVSSLLKSYDAIAKESAAANKRAEADARKAEEAAKKLADATTKQAQATAGGITQIMQGAIAGIAALGVGGVLNSALSAFQGLETVTLRLGASITSSGRQVEPVMTQYRQFARAMEATTTASQAEVLALLQQSEAMGVVGGNAQRAVRGAIGLAAAQGIGTREAIRMTAALEQGNSSMVAERFPALRMITDESQRAAGAHRLLGQAFQVAQSEANSSAGGFKRLQNAYQALQEEAGAVVAKAIGPVVEMARSALKWFEKLSPQVKETVIAVGLVVAGTVALGVAIGVAGTVFNTFFGGIGLVIGIAATATAAWVSSVGGVEKAWKKAQAAFTEFYDFVYPALNALWGLVTTGFETVKQVATTVWQFFTQMWRSITGAAAVNWTQIRDTVTDVLLWFEFLVGNWRRFWDFAVASIALRMYAFVQEVRHWFTSTLPTAASYVRDVVVAAFGDIVNNATALFRNLADNIVNTVSSLPDLIAGRTNWSEVWRPLTAGFQRTLVELPQFAGRVRDQVERELQGTVDQLGASLFADWEAFRRRRLAEMNRTRPDQAPPRPDEEPTRPQFRPTAAPGVFDAALAGSAEAASRLAAFQDAVAGQRNPAQQMADAAAANARAAADLMGAARAQQLAAARLFDAAQAQQALRAHAEGMRQVQQTAGGQVARAVAEMFGGFFGPARQAGGQDPGWQPWQPGGGQAAAGQAAAGIAEAFGWLQQARQPLEANAPGADIGDVVQLLRDIREQGRRTAGGMVIEGLGFGFQ